MDIGAIIIIIVISLMLVITFYIIGIYNKLINARNKVEDKFIQIDAEIDKKLNLITNLIEIIKENLKHEDKIINELQSAYTKLEKTTSINGKIKGVKNLDKELNKIYLLTETYKDLKTNKNYNQIKKNLDIIDERIEYSKAFYNDTVSNYNNIRKEFPSNIISKIFKFNEIEHFK